MGGILTAPSGTCLLGKKVAGALVGNNVGWVDVGWRLVLVSTGCNVGNVVMGCRVGNPVGETGLFDGCLVGARNEGFRVSPNTVGYFVVGRAVYGSRTPQSKQSLPYKHHKLDEPGPPSYK